MTRKPKWVFWVRGTLLSALCGHWIANLLLDPGQYERAGLEYTWRAALPVLFQTTLVMMVMVVLGALSDRERSTRDSRGRLRSNLVRLLILLVTSQLLLFLLMEVSERVIQREPFTDGLFASGFAFELLFAIGSALLLVLLGSVARRVFDSLRREALTARIDDRILATPEGIVRAHAAVVMGGVRGPPPLPV